MNQIITKIEIDSFRSIWKQTLKTDNVNVFSGLNDVGKSNVLKAINLFFNGQTDFGTDYDFEIDYSKVSLAYAQRSSKKKQQVKIKIYLKAPASFKSLFGEEIWMERVFDRFGTLSENYSVTDAKKRASVTRLVNSIKYFYIPALKGPDVIKYILGEVGKRQLVSDKDIQRLNDQVNDNIKDLANILTSSAIKNETRFELPVLVEDFWQKLSINTKYDQFSELDGKINLPKKGERTLLRKENFQIPLQLRGDGVKSKFIPPLLQWIQKHESNKFYVWGVDEPENSLEFKKAQEVADLYYSEYSKDTQLFLTSHSLAFIFTDNNNVQVVRCYKGEYGDTRFEEFNDLFKNIHKLNLADEIGALEIQKEIYNEWRAKDEQINDLNNEIVKIKKPVIFVEGEIDEKYLKHTLEVFNMSTYPAEIKCIGRKNESGNYDFSGDSFLTAAEKFLISNPPHHKVIIFYDVDCGKEVKTLENLTVYCPEKNVKARYKTGIEHLLVIPDTFNTNSANFIDIKVNGDKTTTMPKKKEILNYVFSLPVGDQKKWLTKIKDILDDFKSTF